jgi:sirohydrochlorin ferrochelatase
VVSFFGYYGHKMVSQELDRRATTAAAKDAALATARAAARRGVRDMNFAADAGRGTNTRDDGDDDAVESDDPFDGMTPEEIQALVASETAPPRA